MDKEKLINFLEECIDNLNQQKELLKQRYMIMSTCDEDEFILNKPVSAYQERKEYVENIKQLKLTELAWEILSVEDKIYGYETQLQMTKNGEEKTE